MKLLSTLIIILGCILLAFSLYLIGLRYSPTTLAFEKEPTPKVALNSQSPQEIVIPSIDLRLPIYSQGIADGKWETTSRGASYLASSPIPGQLGNSVIYGHNWEVIFADLTDVVPGDVVIIAFSDNSQMKFVVEYTATVDPSDTYIIDNTNDARLTIYTCTGFLDSKRFVVVAKPVSSAQI